MFASFLDNIKFFFSFQKSYDSVDKAKDRFEIFCESLKTIDKLNAENNGARFGINQFADLKSHEFMHPKQRNSEDCEQVTEVVKSDHVPDSYDLRDSGYVAPVQVTFFYTSY